MKHMLCTLVPVIAIISLCGCGGSAPRGFYVSEGTQDPCCIEFKSNGHAILRDLSSPSASVAETTYIVERKVVRLHEFKLFGINSAVELSIVDDTLVGANGVRFKKDTSGRTFTPAELLAEAQKKAAAIKAKEEQMQKERWQATLKKEQERRRLNEEVNKHRAEQERQAALERQAEEERATANEKAQEEKAVAKQYAATHLPTFTNKVVTITCNDGQTYTNIILTSATLDGLSYKTIDGTGLGRISYMRIPFDCLEGLHIDTNIVALAEDRAVAKAEADRKYNELSAEQARKADEARRSAAARVNSAQAARDAFAKRYGVKR